MCKFLMAMGLRRRPASVAEHDAVASVLVRSAVSIARDVAAAGVSHAALALLHAP